MRKCHISDENWSASSQFALLWMKIFISFAGCILPMFHNPASTIFYNELHKWKSGISNLCTPAVISRLRKWTDIWFFQDFADLLSIFQWILYMKGLTLNRHTRSYIILFFWINYWFLYWFRLILHFWNSTIWVYHTPDRVPQVQTIY